MRNRQSLTLSLLMGGLLLAAPLVAQAGGTINRIVDTPGNPQFSPMISHICCQVLRARLFLSHS